MVFGFGLNRTSESSVRAKYTIYLPSFLAATHYYVAFPLADILFITKDPLLVPQESRNVDVHPEDSVMDIHREHAYIIIPQLLKKRHEKHRKNPNILCQLRIINEPGFG